MSSNADPGKGADRNPFYVRRESGAAFFDTALPRGPMHARYANHAMKCRAVMVMWAACSAAGCFLAPPEGPTAPPVSASTPAVPARITLSAVAGIGNAAGLAFIAARVLDGNGSGIPYAAVTLTTSTGVIAASTGSADRATGPSATGTTGADGLLQGTVKTSGATTVTASAGGTSASISINIVGP